LGYFIKTEEEEKLAEYIKRATLEWKEKKEMNKDKIGTDGI